MVEPIKTLAVSHLGGIDVGYRLSASVPDKTKPTLVLFNPFTTTADYYLPEFKSKSFRESVTLLAIEPLGHGQTRLRKGESFTYWDSAIMALQVLDALGINKAFAMGTSQGGWIAARMALIAPERIQGIIPIGSSLDTESPRSRDLGCWDGPGATSGLVSIAGDPTPINDFEPGNDYNEFLMDIGYGKTVDNATKNFWADTIKANYHGNEGKKRICMAAIALATRDGLRERVSYIRCPVLWLQGTADVVFSVAMAQEDIKLFNNSEEATLIVCEGGPHFLSWTHQKRIEEEVLGFIYKHKGCERSVL